MRPYALFLVLSAVLVWSGCADAVSESTTVPEEPAFTLVIHGGAGTITRESMTPELEEAYRTKLTEALEAGHAVLADEGTSLDAVVAAIQVMEESPLFNSGHGAVLNSQGEVELDASIMDGKTHAAGAVAGVRHIKSPIALARLVMEESPHVMMVGDGAEQFAEGFELERVPNEYFMTERRKRQLQRVQEREQSDAGQGAAALDPVRRQLDPATIADVQDRKLGTVGAVALDVHGNLAAATSTGGMTNKRYGRVGDSPIIGAGTYADNATCAVSATGHGEYFIRGVIAHDVASMMRYAGTSLEEAASAVIDDKLTAAGGTGGIIAVDREGNVAMPFNTEGMYRGYITADGSVTIGIYGQ